MFLTINLAQDKSKQNNYLSTTLLKKIKNNLNKNLKTILYLNKRWFFSSFICSNCNYIYKCNNCDVSLTVHNNPQRLVCHICWYQEKITNNCKKCNKNELKTIWVWTQQIENSIKTIFKNSNIYRLDTDNIKTKKSKNNVLKDIEKANIIIWTKMITTGFDFKKIWLIWIILLEWELSIPKYNTEENLYLNIKQLFWRWERLWKKTDFIIQTFIPKNEIIKDIWENNYKDFFLRTLQERKLFNYPPFSEITTLEYRNKNKQKSIDFMSNLKNKLDIINQDNLYTINLVPNVYKKYNQYYKKIVIRWKNIKIILNKIKNEIMKNSNLVVIFE